MNRVIFPINYVTFTEIKPIILAIKSLLNHLLESTLNGNQKQQNDWSVYTGYFTTNKF